MAQPMPYVDAVQPRLLTITEYLELGETEPGYTELVEGRAHRVPSPYADHNRAGFRFAVILEPQLPPHLEVILDIDVDLEFAAPDEPGSSRRPDFIVVHRDARRRQRAEGGIIRASEVVVVGEIVSPGSKRTDYVAKRSEYADAGIPYYWIIDLREPVSLLACHQAGEFGSVVASGSERCGATTFYADSGEVTGRFATPDPFPLTIDLDALL